MPPGVRLIAFPVYGDFLLEQVFPRTPAKQ